jgi:hypothetical protein
MAGEMEKSLLRTGLSVQDSVLLQSVASLGIFVGYVSVHPKTASLYHSCGHS